ncbi:MAG TPA: hypothetical protein VE078_04075 [Thermoanaerobaculia bacterium]|nr:hypothetical protein [Thermoanaerobaculia bacterium]
MARVRKALNVVSHWDQVVDGVGNNQAELSELESKKLELAQTGEEVRALSTQQGVLTASKQETSKRLKAALRRGAALADFLRTGVRQVYGYGSEKLVEFGMQPIRPRSRVSGSEPTPIPAEATLPDEPAE